MADISGMKRGDDVAFVKDLIERVGVAAVPGSSFFANPALRRDWIRFCFPKNETLDEAERRLAIVIGGLLSSPHEGTAARCSVTFQMSAPTARRPALRLCLAARLPGVHIRQLPSRQRPDRLHQESCAERTENRRPKRTRLHGLHSTFRACRLQQLHVGTFAIHRSRQIEHAAAIRNSVDRSPPGDTWSPEWSGRYPASRQSRWRDLRGCVRQVNHSAIPPPGI